MKTHSVGRKLYLRASCGYQPQPDPVTSPLILSLHCNHTSPMFAAALRPGRPRRLPALHNILKPYSTASPLTTVPLSFNRYDPPTRDGAPPGDTPMVIMHGLFGSKQNNRSISRYLPSLLTAPHPF